MRIAFIGLGRMGQPMSARLAQAGFSLATHDLNGSGSCASSKEAANGVEVFLTMLPDGKAVREAVLAAELAPGTLVLDMSSADPVGTRKLGAELAARGIAMVDAPVSGGVKKAVDGTLAIMAGGEPAHVERVRPVLEKLGARVFLTGSLGTGHAMKALNNYLSAAGTLATSEALVVGQAFGLDQAVMTDILNASTGRNNATEVKAKQFMLSGTFAAGFSMGLMVKDLATAASLAESVGARAEFARRCAELWREAAGALGPDADHTEIYRHVGGWRTD